MVEIVQKRYGLNFSGMVIMNIKMIMNGYVTKSKTPPPPLSIFMVRLILCDCSLCQHGFDIQINQNILEKLISLEAKLLYISRAVSNFYETEIEIWAGF